MAYDILGKGGLLVAPPLEDGLAGLRAFLPDLEQIVPIRSLSVAVWPTAKHWPDQILNTAV